MSPKKLALLSMVAVVAMVVGVWQTWRVIAPGDANGHVPGDFPHAFLAPADDGLTESVKIWRGRVAPATLDVNGTTCFPAYACRNTDCPGRSGDRPYIFANTTKGSIPTCPKCVEAIAKAAPADKGKFDPGNVGPFYTPEAAAIVSSIQSASR